jgi:uncharacterized LabA/DUF88 family protein
MERVIAYIDGFNLYFGLKSKGWRRYYWLNVQMLARNLLKPHQRLLITKYLTARITGAPQKEKRQSTYIEALETLSKFQIFYGEYKTNPRECPTRGCENEVPNEKATDVNIAVEMLKDAYQDEFDVALLVSADSDPVPPIKTVRELLPGKRVVVACPPGRYSTALTESASNSLVIGRNKIAKSLFPPRIKKADGYILRCPRSWKQEENRGHGQSFIDTNGHLSQSDP